MRRNDPWRAAILTDHLRRHDNLYVSMFPIAGRQLLGGTLKRSA
jgi:hypothetical protein